MDAADLPVVPRDDRWWDLKKNLYVRHFEACGGVRVDLDDIQPHDVVLAHFLSEQVNHGGVYVGNGLVKHHLPGRLARAEPVGRWRHLITHVLRYKHAAEGENLLLLGPGAGGSAPVGGIDQPHAPSTP